MSSDPVTLMVARRVARGRYRDLTAWLEEGRELASDFAGYLGSGVLAPPPGDDEYQIIFRFRDAETLAAWEHSASRRAWLARGEGLFEAPHEHRATGLDGWFQDATGRTPPRWKQAIAIWLAFFPVSLAFQWLFGEALAGLPLVPRVLAGTLALTPLMVFGFIPLSMRLLGPWLRGEVMPLARLGRRLHQRGA
ncbi:antibiotic biosynthesis monooxygenase [Halomonas ramblicola]|uniref:antibiotic biosynthesis monooxygenase n=1 Tax=Halomonas ramblicola TaxID=747349 RepID=UPI0025B3FE36|nr:antibiotic biosynthesis monooxygenase [Halomonas ramblicola]MDN3519933.1 antibiotic biosynthesis monooxygenase [Halomonas ramblicola]